MSLIKLTLLIVCLSNLTDSKKIDCVGIPIAYEDFEKSVDRLNALYSNNHIRSKEDFILSVRVYNTLTMNHMVNDNEKHKQFCDFFTKKLERTIRALRASISKGMGYYSKKYNIYLGGHPDANSMFCLK